MANNKIISVWLEIEDGINKGKIILQKRSSKNKTFKFVCQATWSGKVEPDEDLEEAVARECKEELGESFCKKFDFSNLELLNSSNFINGNEDWVAYNYFCKIKEKISRFIKMHKEALPELVFVDKGCEFYSINSAKNPKDSVVLFDDQYRVLKKILKKI